MDEKKGQGDSLSPEVVKLTQQLAKDPKSSLFVPIVQLTEKLVKDPKSRLFVALAEEYLKVGMLDEAVTVLTDGIRVHPTFHAARAALGKVYLEKGAVAEARAKFEQVIQANPENFLAHRKLAKIYKDAGQTDKARISCQAVLVANPKDAEMKTILEELNRIEQAQRQEEQAGGSVSMESASVEILVEQTAHASPDVKSEPAAVEASPSPAEAPPAEEVPPTVAEAAPPEPVVTEPKEPAASVEEILGAPEPFHDEGRSVSPPPSEAITTEALADLYIQQGYYDKGIDIYRRLLANDPSNQVLFKKLDEAVERMKALHEDASIKRDSKPSVQPAAPVFHSDSAAQKSPEPETPSATDRERQKIQKMQRLQAWLDSVKKGQAS